MRARRLRALPILALLAPAAGRAEGMPAFPPGVQAEIHQMTFVASRHGVRELLIEAARTSVPRDTQVAILEDVHAVFEGEPGKPGFELDCDRGELTTTTNDFYATGNVHGRTNDGRSFTTDWVRYDPRRGVVFTDAPVAITDSGGTYQGGGFRYVVREQRFRLLGGASLVRSP